ncbi:2-amino-4-hydroxy-6-hydroxymethyldihydropteridine diphosphokinase [Robiginitalea sp.]|uniref:2-amino-4-hydroxy-6- hydroxymethyldihydropteridine diphosphokinase n=1 Tax=Robiginitalea sp. TaxID=1902411 RepID=UPI003C6452C0
MKKAPVLAYISLGSNLGNRAYYLQKAIFSLGNVAGEIEAISPVYQTAAWGFDGGDFLNACIALRTELPPEGLLQCLLQIEKAAGRERFASGGYRSRTLDLDLLYYGGEIIRTDTLTVPHPSLEKRRFVLRPLADIAPQFYHPVLRKDHRNLLQECADKNGLERTSIVLYKNRQLFFNVLGFVVIEGNIGAGKTSLARKISEDLNAKLILERFEDNPFLPKFYQDRARYAFPLELSFLADRYQQFIEETRQLDLFKNFVVSDYDIYKSLIFAKITLGQEEFKLYRKFFSVMYREVRKPKLYVYLYQNTGRLLEQIARRGRDYEEGIPAEYLEKIQSGYFDFMKHTPGLNSLIVDAGDLDFVSRPEDYHTILDQMIAHVLLKQG